MVGFIHRHIKILLVITFLYTAVGGVVGFVSPETVAKFAGADTLAPSTWFAESAGLLLFFFSFVFLISARAPTSSRPLLLLAFAEKGAFCAYLIAAIVKEKLAVTYWVGPVLDGVTAAFLAVYLFVRPKS